MTVRSPMLLCTCLVTLAIAAAPTAHADMTLVDENFDSYADQFTLEGAWTPDAGDGATPIGTTGVLIPTTDSNFVEPNNNPPGLVGNGVGNFGGINEWSGALDVLPSETQSVKVQGDIFVDGQTATWRQTIGLRNDTIDRDPDTFGPQLGSNLFEMGFYNAATCDPTVDGCDTSGSVIRDPSDPGYIPGTQFGYRFAIFQFGTLGKLFHNGEEVGDLLTTPNWQYFPLDPALDLEENGGDGDGTTNIADLEESGQGFHRFTATITPTDFTMELDLFRNGVNEVTGESGPDSTVTVEIGLFEDPANPGTVASFTSLRIGGPSGITSLKDDSDPNPGIFDNIFLALEDVAAGLEGDFNGDAIVDARDYTLWRDSLGAAVDAGTGADGSGNGLVDDADYAIWADNYGAGSGALAGAVAAPEPSSVLLAALPAALVAARRRRAT